LPRGEAVRGPTPTEIEELRRRKAVIDRALARGATKRRSTVAISHGECPIVPLLDRLEGR
jgi:hypothetical protein